ncbi:hypothetical protein SNK03_007738 [Fusarium graminearum]
MQHNGSTASQERDRCPSWPHSTCFAAQKSALVNAMSCHAVIQIVIRVRFWPVHQSVTCISSNGSWTSLPQVCPRLTMPVARWQLFPLWFPVRAAKCPKAWGKVALRRKTTIRKKNADADADANAPPALE